MKWVVVAGLIVMVPVLYAWLKTRPREAVYLWFLVAFIPFVAASWRLVVAPVSWPSWPGYVKGMELALIDPIVIAILLARPAFKGKIPFVGVWVAFLLANLFSSLFADVTTASLFVSWQILRTLLIFLAIAVCADDPRVPRMLMSGMVAGIVLNAGFALEQRFTGAMQSAGLFTHQNQAGMASHFVAFPALAMLLSGKRSTLAMIGIAAALVVVVLTASRATIALAGLGYVLVLLLVTLRRPTGRKFAMTMGAGLALLAVAPLAISNLERRFVGNPTGATAFTTEDGERDALARTAEKMWSAHPFGVGANQYVNVANMEGYAVSAGVNWSFGSRSAHVHNGFLLAGAEAGYLGFLALIALLAWPTIFALRAAWRYRRSPDSDLMVGLAVSTIVVAIHSLFEWVFFTYPVQWLFAINLGMMACLAYQMQRGSQLERRRVQRAMEPAPA